MNPETISRWMRGRAMAAVACAALALPLAGCGSKETASGANLPPVNDYAGGGPARTAMSGGPAPQTPPRQGMSTGKKVVLLAGAAALYYMWRKHNAAAKANNGMAEGQPIYYLSKNGQVYYRDANKQPHYVTPPPQGYQVPQSELSQYQGIDQLQGYDGSNSGTTDLSRFATQGGGY